MFELLQSNSDLFPASFAHCTAVKSLLFWITPFCLVVFLFFSFFFRVNGNLSRSTTPTTKERGSILRSTTQIIHQILQFTNMTILEFSDWTCGRYGLMDNYLTNYLKMVNNLLYKPAVSTIFLWIVTGHQYTKTNSLSSYKSSFVIIRYIP